jgi:hypothetical protein
MHGAPIIASLREGPQEGTMSERTLEVLTERLDRLERENHWWRRLGLSFLLATVAIATLGQAPARSVLSIIQAERFVLVDEGGNVRGELGITDAGMTRFVLRQPGPEGHASFAELQPAGLALHERKGRPYLRMGSSEFSLHSGTSRAGITMRIADESGMTRATLGRTKKLQEERLATAEEHFASSLVLLGKDGKVIWKAPPPTYVFPPRVPPTP